MFFALELQPSGVYVPSNWQGLFIPSKRIKRVRNIALSDDNNLKDIVINEFDTLCFPEPA